MSSDSVSKEKLQGTFYPHATDDDVVGWEITGNQITLGDHTASTLAVLSSEERVLLFNAILAEYRKAVHDPDGFKGAAVVIDKDNNVFIGMNTAIEHGFHKNCAEKNAVNAMVQDALTHDRDPQVEAIYVMAGFDNTEDSSAPAAPCLPCGLCMDLLASHSSPKTDLIIFPPNNGAYIPALNHAATSLRDLPAGDAWITTINHLLVDATIHLTRAERAFGKKGLAAITGNETLQTEHVDEASLKELFSSDSLSPQQTRLRQIITQYTNNHLQGIESIPELDVDSSLESINRFMVGKIAAAYQSRSVTAGEGLTTLRNVEKIRCVVMRLSDGTFHYSPEIIGPEENATTYAGATSVASSRLSNSPIQDVWVMEMDPKAIAEGTMSTSPKEELERIYKKGNHVKKPALPGEETPPVNIHYIPFNDGSLRDEQLRASMRSYDIETIFLSQFKGPKRELSGSDGPQLH